MSHPPNSTAAFFDGIKSGQHDRVAELLRADPGLVRAFDAPCFGATPLSHAAGLGDLRMIDLLIDAGADPNTPNDWEPGGFRPLDDADEATSNHLLSRGATLTPHAAARLGRAKALAAILDASPELVRQRGGDGQLPLHFAANVEIAGLLLDRGAEIDARDLDHASTAAQWAACDRPEVAAFLVSRGAQADLFLACMIDDVALAASLLHTEPGGVAARITPQRFPAPGSHALGIYHYTVGNGCTPLHAAATANAARTCRWLIEQGADVNATGGYDDATPLHQAAWQNRPAAAAALLDGGAAIDKRSGAAHRNTPLGWAIVAGSAEMVELLLARGAAVLDFHPVDAAAGARGKFRCFKRRVPLEAWIRIEKMFAARRTGQTRPR